MPCPYFLPEAEIRVEDWGGAPRLPLGAPFRGTCRASTAPVQPEPALLRDCCNLGYARGKCRQFPDNSAADANRFTAFEQETGTLCVTYIVERNYAPASFGVFHYSISARTIADAPADPLLLRQAEEYARVFVRRRVPTGRTRQAAAASASPA
jgi:hypothetical protein